MMGNSVPVGPARVGSMHTRIAIKGEMLGPEDYCEPLKHTGAEGPSYVRNEAVLLCNSEASPSCRLVTMVDPGRGCAGYRGMALGPTRQVNGGGGG